MSEVTATVPSAPRRYDLDALRAIAMLLGIALHAALSFTEFPWAVQDSRQNDIFSLFFFAVHGFRMPLFFLLSGFFTAMLWRKRGLGSLLIHRIKRIFVPLIIAAITIIPATHFASILANSPAVSGTQKFADRESQPERNDLWKAAAEGDLEFLDANMTSENVNQLDSTFGVSPLGFAALFGHADSARKLIEHGADVNLQMRDRSTPLHSAAFLGRTDVVKVLLENGADTQVLNQHGSTPAGGLQADWATTQMIAGMLKIPVERDELMAARAQIGELLEQANPEEERFAGMSQGEREQQLAREKMRRDLAGVIVSSLPDATPRPPLVSCLPLLVGRDICHLRDRLQRPRMEETPRLVPVVSAPIRLADSADIHPTIVDGDCRIWARHFRWAAPQTQLLVLLRHLLLLRSPLLG